VKISQQVFLVSSIALLVSCAEITPLRTGEYVLHSDKLDQTNRTIAVYGMGRSRLGFTTKMWKTYTWSGTSYLCTRNCLGTESPLRDFDWQTPLRTSPYVRNGGDTFKIKSVTVPIISNVHDRSRVPKPIPFQRIPKNE
jgi:hypothetical protein